MSTPLLGREPWLRVDPSLTLESPVLADFVALWDGWRGDRRMPSRHDFDAATLRGHLGWVLLIDVTTAPQRYRYRLIGTNIVAAVGRDSTGAYLDGLYAPHIYADLCRLHDLTVETRRPVRSSGHMEHVERGYVDFEAVEVPLSNDDDTVNMLMMRTLISF